MRLAPALPLILAAATVLTACGGGRERPGPREEGPMDPDRIEHLYNQFVERWDYNEDGQATCDDVRVQRARLFKLLDTDKDGVLISGEYRYAQFEDKSFMFFDFVRIDKDSSGQISLEELTDVPNSVFNSADKDHDCIISREEAMMALRDSRRESAGPGGEEGGRGGRGGKGGRGGRPGGGGQGGPGGSGGPY